MRRLSYSLFILCFAALDSFAQGILPSSLPGWNSKPANPASSANEPRAGGLSAAVLQEYGSTGTQSMAYSRSGQILHATVYSFQDASGAYGAYSILRTPEMMKTNYSEHSAKTADQVLVLTGNLVLDVTGRDLHRDESSVKLLAADVSSHAQQGVYPALPLQLPAKDLIPHSDRYFLGPIALGQFWDAKGVTGDWLGFSKGAEAVVAKYRVQGHDETLLLVDYPTPQIGASQTEKISQEFKIDLTGQEKKSKESPETESEYYWRRDGTLVALVAGARSEADSNQVLDQIRSGVIVTWNAPASRLNEPTMAAIIVGTIIGTGEMCLIAIIIGAMFSLVRLGINRAWPGKVFDRPQDLEILQLRLTSRPLKGKDFY